MIDLDAILADVERITNYPWVVTDDAKVRIVTHCRSLVAEVERLTQNIEAIRFRARHEVEKLKAEVDRLRAALERIITDQEEAAFRIAREALEAKP